VVCFFHTDLDDLLVCPTKQAEMLDFFKGFGKA